MQLKNRNNKCVGKCKFSEKINAIIRGLRYKTGISKAKITDIRPTEGKKDEQRDILLIKAFQRSSFGNDIADQFVIFFNAALLVGLAGIAIENSGSFEPVMRIKRLLKGNGILEFGTVIGQNDRKELVKKIKTQNIFKPVKLT